MISSRMCSSALLKVAAKGALAPVLLGGVLLLMSAPALGAGGGGSGASEVLFLGQVVTLLFVGRVFGEIAQRVGQPAVMGQLLAGIALGPSMFGLVWPEGQHALFPPNPTQKAMLDAVSQLGILLILLITGMETDLGLVKKVRRAAFSVSATGVAVPFICGFGLGQFLPDSVLPKPELRLITSLFLGTALSISSVKIVAMVVREMDFLRRNVGQIIVASAIIDDTIGWVIIAITFSLALHGSVDVWALGQTLVGTALFLIVSLTVGRRLVFLLIRWANDELHSEAALITAILVVMGLMALLTHAIGVHTVLGAFVAGILVGQSPILTRLIEEQLRGLIAGLFAPVFFCLAGLSADLGILQNPTLLGVTAALIGIASIGKFLGAFTGGTIGGLKPAESLALACGMNARGSTEVVVASIGLSIGALNQDLFTMIVAMAVVTTLAMPPTLRWALARLPLDEAERERLAREDFENKGFVTSMERMLVVADPTAKGRFASRLAGLIAGCHGMPVTVIPLEAHATAAQAPAKELADVVANAARGTACVEEEGGAPPATTPIDVTPAAVPAAPDQAVADASAKGFDFLLVGVEPTGAPEGGFNKQVAEIVDRFDGPFGIIAARGEHLRNPDRASLNMLVPVTGTDVSRRGTEVALSLAQASRANVTALFVSNPAQRRRPGRLNIFRRSSEAVLKEFAQLADLHGVALRTAKRTGIPAEDAILRQARLGRHDMIVMGVARRPGETLSFGSVAETLLEASDRTVVFVASGAGPKGDRSGGSG